MWLAACHLIRGAYSHSHCHLLIRRPSRACLMSLPGSCLFFCLGFFRSHVNFLSYTRSHDCVMRVQVCVNDKALDACPYDPNHAHDPTTERIFACKAGVTPETPCTQPSSTSGTATMGGYKTTFSHSRTRLRFNHLASGCAVFGWSSSRITMTQHTQYTGIIPHFHLFDLLPWLCSESSLLLSLAPGMDSQMYLTMRLFGPVIRSHLLLSP